MRRRIEQVQPRAWVTTLASSAAAAVDIGVEVGLQQRDRPLSLRRRCGWLAAAHPCSPERTEALMPVRSSDPAELPAEVVLRHRRDGTEAVLPADLSASVEQVGDDGEIVWSGTARFEADPGRCRFTLTEGRYDLLVRTRAWGLDRETTLSAAGLDVHGPDPDPDRSDGRIDRFASPGRDISAWRSAPDRVRLLSRLAASQVVAERQGIVRRYRRAVDVELGGGVVVADSSGGWRPDIDHG